MRQRDQLTHVIEGVEAAVRELKAKPGRELQLHGSGQLFRRDDPDLSTDRPRDLRDRRLRAQRLGAQRHRARGMTREPAGRVMQIGRTHARILGQLTPPFARLSADRPIRPTERVYEGGTR